MSTAKWHSLLYPVPTTSSSAEAGPVALASVKHQSSILKPLPQTLNLLPPVPLPHLRPLLFLRRPRLQLQRMYPAHSRHLLLQQRIHHSMPGRLHLARECARRYHDAEVGFVAVVVDVLHGGVVGV